MTTKAPDPRPSFSPRRSFARGARPCRGRRSEVERSSIPGARERMRRCGEEGQGNEGHQRCHSLHELVQFVHLQRAHGGVLFYRERVDTCVAPEDGYTPSSSVLSSLRRGAGKRHPVQHFVHPNLHHHAPTLFRGRVGRSRSRMDCPQAHRLLSEAGDGGGDPRVPLIPLPGRLWTLPQG
jgi:hypothetical protein